MSIDYRDQVCNRPLDTDGFELPPWLNPFLSDFNPALAEQADIAWLNENPTLPPISGGSPDGPSDADWEEYHLWSVWQDRMESLKQMEDHEYELCMRYGG